MGLAITLYVVGIILTISLVYIKEERDRPTVVFVVIVFFSMTSLLSAVEGYKHGEREGRGKPRTTNDLVVNDYYEIAINIESLKTDYAVYKQVLLRRKGDKFPLLFHIHESIALPESSKQFIVRRYEGESSANIILVPCAWQDD